VLLCTWPHGGRPDVPTRYADEVWTGSEYQLAAHCLYEGLNEEAHAVLAAVWGRYDGRRRNPFNEIECGDHYVRAMAGWSVLDALTGFAQDAPAAAFRLAWPESERPLPFLASAGWGLCDRRGNAVTIDVTGGRVEIRSIRIAGRPADYRAFVDNVPVALTVSGDEIAFPQCTTITAGHHLTLVTSPW
jgi:hypothetical protein